MLRASGDGTRMARSGGCANRCRGLEALFANRGWPSDRTAEHLLEQRPRDAQQVADADHRQAGVTVRREVLPDECVRRAAADPHHGGHLFDGQQIWRRAVRRDVANRPHLYTCLSKREFVTLLVVKIGVATCGVGENHAHGALIAVTLQLASAPRVRRVHCRWSRLGYPGRRAARVTLSRACYFRWQRGTGFRG